MSDYDQVVVAAMRNLDEARISHRRQRRWAYLPAFFTVVGLVICYFSSYMIVNSDHDGLWIFFLILATLAALANISWLMTAISIIGDRAKDVREAGYAYEDSFSPAPPSIETAHRIFEQHGFHQKVVYLSSNAKFPTTAWVKKGN